LIEALIALGIAVTIIAAIANIVVTSLNNTSFSKNENLATIYAQQGMESVRKLINSSYIAFKKNYTASSYCLDQNNNLIVKSTNCNNIKTGIYIREVSFDQNSPDCQVSLKTVVSVSWSDSKCTDRFNLYCHSVTLSSCFVDKNEVPSPI